MKMNPKERAFAARVAELGCSVRGRYGDIYYCKGNTEINHASNGAGTGRKNPNWMIHGLCYNHHRGTYGLHQLGTRAWEGMFGDQREHVKWVYEQLGEEMPELSSKIVPRNR